MSKRRIELFKKERRECDTFKNSIDRGVRAQNLMAKNREQKVFKKRLRKEKVEGRGGREGY